MDDLLKRISINSEKEDEYNIEKCFEDLGANKLEEIGSFPLGSGKSESSSSQGLLDMEPELDNLSLPKVTAAFQSRSAAIDKNDSLQFSGGKKQESRRNSRS